MADQARSTYEMATHWAGDGTVPECAPVPRLPFGLPDDELVNARAYERAARCGSVKVDQRIRHFEQLRRVASIGYGSAAALFTMLGLVGLFVSGVPEVLCLIVAATLAAKRYQRRHALSDVLADLLDAQVQIRGAHGDILEWLTRVEAEYASKDAK